MSALREFVHKHLSLEIIAVGLGLHAYLSIIGLTPLTIGVLVEGYEFDLKTAGLFASMQIVAMTLTNLGIAPYVARFRCSRLAIAGGLTIAAGNLFVAAVSDTSMIAAGLLIAGVGYGTISAAVNASVANDEEPENIYASGILIYSVLGSLLLAIVPTLYVEIAYPLFFVVGAVIDGVAVVF
jgi:hypothetical protein